MYKYFFKRLLDFLISLCATPFILVLILLFAPFIYISDKGPIFYNAPRIGKDGRPFKMFKLRSMYVNSPDLRNADGSTFNSDNDPRVTPIGRFLRNTIVVELTQLFNLFLGDICFVGPRHSLKTTAYEDYDEIRKKRVSVRPGVTGYSQAFFRNSISQNEKFKYDCEYVDKMSFFLDLKILWQTAICVIKHKNIYVG